MHCCADADIASLLAAGPGGAVGAGRANGWPTSPATSTRFLEGGGRIAWGVVPTDGPILDDAASARGASSATCGASWSSVAAIPSLLRQRSLVTPQCGLGMHTPAVADRVVRLTREVGRRVNEQAVASRFALGA